MNEFYSGILVKKSDLNLSMRDPDLLYTHFNDIWREYTVEGGLDKAHRVSSL